MQYEPKGLVIIYKELGGGGGYKTAGEGGHVKFYHH